MFSGYGRDAAIGIGIAALRACFANRSILNFRSVDDFNAGRLRMLKTSNLESMIMNLAPTLGTRKTA
jgi:hypothetical protein